MEWLALLRPAATLWLPQWQSPSTLCSEVSPSRILAYLWFQSTPFHEERDVWVVPHLHSVVGGWES